MVSAKIFFYPLVSLSYFVLFLVVHLAYELCPQGAGFHKLIQHSMEARIFWFPTTGLRTSGSFFLGENTHNCSL